jgi:hypothetical protein
MHEQASKRASERTSFQILAVLIGGNLAAELPRKARARRYQMLERGPVINRTGQSLVPRTKVSLSQIGAELQKSLSHRAFSNPRASRCRSRGDIRLIYRASRLRNS